ncbi:MAG: segregation/condensation protein A [Candidatus Omnitrophica bacterium]|nr:segregation/condensation protein A [Candidatus Omnitrophota bacterium]MBU1048322.1 segregation/condensation protein A [Candidatus Omnitrophota bacterium]MBU1630289.1 segregation/condensation protein A [Candidatus Omnitrophota bacterium]MBU1767443.1 segregation/condensation protein A [Candidatus Omnitrophota bacterium]MBU1889696.1 segregation/condensation protein A [Candidatus Omnitrophota bacterium]
MTYNVKLESFAGPLDLLLHLVRKNELDIFKIPIAQITDEYLKYIELVKELNLDIAGEFIVYAATLMYLKSRNLLPTEQKTEEEILDEERQLQELKEKLAEYERFKDLALQLGQRQHNEKQLFARQPLLPLEENGQIDATLFDLLDAFSIILKEAEQKQILEIEEENITVNDKIILIQSVLKTNKKITFSSLFAKAKSRQEMVVTFMALLELIRLKEIIIKQSSHFGEIWLYSNSQTSLKTGKETFKKHI